jgi:hypothetical protein
MAIHYREGVADDSRVAFDIFLRSMMDLAQRLGVNPISGGDDPQIMASLWERRQPLYDHLAQTGDQFWAAELNGEPLGYARSILRDGVQELTEYFVLPGNQSAGIDRELLARAFPVIGARHRVTIATTDMRATVRYLKAGLTPRFPNYYFTGTPVARHVKTDLQIEPVTDFEAAILHINWIDEVVLGHRREVDQRWLLATRQAYIYSRADQVVGYGYLGEHSGPFALLDAQDYAAVLAHAETVASGSFERLGLEVPAVNRAAVDYLLARGYLMDAFFSICLSDVPFGRLEHYIYTSPPYFL